MAYFEDKEMKEGYGNGHEIINWCTVNNNRDEMVAR